MPSTLAWLDHDATQRDRVQRVLSLFDEKGTVDQLGFGGIRDAFSDRLFPGTSVIHTRLRYVLFVPWMYREFENHKVSSDKVGPLAREFELLLIKPLRDSNEAGVIGGRAGESLRILPSAVYWGALEAWGIRLFGGSRSVYHRALDDIYARRRHNSQAEAPGRLDTWHPALPPAPEDFPDQADLSLTREEAEFVRDRILNAHPRSLLALVARGGEPTDVDYPWQHPDYASFSESHKLVLHHARLFSEMKHGAAVLYNLVLALKAGRDELIEDHGRSLDEWLEGLDMEAIQAWDLDELWELTVNQGHMISPSTRRFVARWIELLRSGRDLRTDREVHEMIRLREESLKGAHSKFRNERALEETWNGHAGLGRLDYRWSTVQVELNDLYAGLGRS